MKANPALGHIKVIIAFCSKLLCLWTQDTFQPITNPGQQWNRRVVYHPTFSLCILWNLPHDVHRVLHRAGVEQLRSTPPA